MCYKEFIFEVHIVIEKRTEKGHYTKREGDAACNADSGYIWEQRDLFMELCKEEDVFIVEQSDFNQ
ncbi:hypothetical protein B2I21_02890 [Chryseobacterium mucoviscidosis]|nr:hypothetical protein B2I21_02890 [Chryseobacterium mucoviscidosis]